MWEGGIQTCEEVPGHSPFDGTTIQAMNSSKSGVMQSSSPINIEIYTLYIQLYMHIYIYLFKYVNIQSMYIYTDIYILI